MSRVTTLIFLGILIALSPFAGLPLYVLAWILPVLGIMVILTGISLRARRSGEAPSAAPAPYEPPQNQ